MFDYGYIKTAAVSPRVTVAAPDDNARRAYDAVQAALAAGAQVICLPELYLSGSTCGDLFAQPVLLDACEAALRWLAEKTRHTAALIAVGLPLRTNGRMYNCAAVLQQGELLGIVPKCNLSQAQCRWFAPYHGDVQNISFMGQTVPFGAVLFTLGGCTIGVEFGEDLSVPMPPAAQIALQGAQLMLCLAACGERVGRHERLRGLLAQQSGRLHCGYVYAGAGAGESSSDQVFSGACLVAENGSVLTESRRFEQDGSAVYACVDLQLLAAERSKSNWPANTGQAMLHAVQGKALPQLNAAQITRKYSPSPFVPQNAQLRAHRCREILGMQTAALAKRLTHTGLQRMILGVSGGLDSTLTLLVAARTADLLGWERERVLCITMPGFGTSQHTRSSVDALAEALEVTLWEIDIRPACELHMQDIGHDPNEHDATYENVQARERTQILMDLANQEEALLLGTGDMSELALGWCTFNADHMSMYNPNGGVPKTLMRYMVDYASDELGAALAGQRVLDTPVSPELLPLDAQGDIAQKTEHIIGSYDVHDFYLYYFYRFGFSPQKLFFMACRAFAGQHAPAQLKAWLLLFLRRFFSQQFKRACSPDGPALGSVSLSPHGGLHMPSDAAADVWLAQAEAIVCEA